MAHDRLSHLRTVGSGFASFIYNISDQDGYKQLEVKCKSLWEALEDNPRLPKLLVNIIVYTYYDVERGLFVTQMPVIKSTLLQEEKTFMYEKRKQVGMDLLRRQ